MLCFAPTLVIARLLQLQSLTFYLLNTPCRQRHLHARIGFMFLIRSAIQWPLLIFAARIPDLHQSPDLI